jgi:hypothetical protein
MGRTLDWAFMHQRLGNMMDQDTGKPGPAKILATGREVQTLDVR